MLFQAHRGVSTEYPENTMPAFIAAFQQGYQVIELDPAFTADGCCVTFHDKKVNRTCRTAAGEVLPEEMLLSRLTFEQLQKLDAGIFMGERFRGTKVPLLSEVLAFAADKNLLVKLDNKFESNFTPEQQQIFFDIVESSGARVAFTCKHPETVERLVKRFPTAQFHYDGPVTQSVLQGLRGVVGESPLTVWLPLPSPLTDWVTVPLASPALCALVKRYASLGLWILETPQQLEEAGRLGADIIETTGSIKPE